MKLLTKSTDYAVRALLYLARHRREVVSSREISRAEKVPLPYLRRILRQLKSERMITAREGVAGGVALKSRPEDVSLSRLIRIFQGEINLLECMFRKRICPNRRGCALRSRIKRIENQVASGFADITLKTLLEEIGRGDKERNSKQ